MRDLLLLAGGASLLAACSAWPTGATQSPYPHRSSAEPFECRNTALDQFRGRPAAAELGPTILRASGAKVLRWVPHGSVVTMEYRSDRVTVWLDAQNRIDRVSCG